MNELDNQLRKTIECVRTPARSTLNIEQIKYQFETLDLLEYLLHLKYDECVGAKGQTNVCKIAIAEGLPQIEKLNTILGSIEKDLNNRLETNSANPVMAKKIKNNLAEITKLQNKSYRLYKSMYALASRRSLYHFANYMEFSRKKKIWDKTADTLKSGFKYCDLMIADPDMLFLRLSCMPGLGKTYLINLLVANMFGNDINLTIIRVSFSDKNVQTSTEQIKKIMCQEEYAEVFPYFADKEVFGNKNTNSEFNINGSTEATNYYGVTRFGALSGARAKVCILDDILKGDMEAENKVLCDNVYDIVVNDAESRADDDKQKMIVIGTIRSIFDPLLRMINDRIGWREDTNNEFTEIIVDEQTQKIAAASIAIPALHPVTNESTVPLRYNTQYLLNQKRKLGRKFDALYQQMPQAITGLAFSWSNLKTYTQLREDNIVRVIATIDPARTGKNYCAMPIFYNYGDEYYYLVDCIYQKKPSNQLYNTFVKKITQHNINSLLVENNIDSSLTQMIGSRLLESGNAYCNIMETYSYIKKEIRIMNAEAGIVNYIIFPDKILLADKPELKNFMEQITTYSYDYPNKFDDAIDSVAMASTELMQNTTKSSGKMRIMSLNAIGGRI